MEGTLQGALLAALLFGGYQASGLCLARLALPGEGPGVRLLVAACGAACCSSGCRRCWLSLWASPPWPSGWGWG